MFDLMTSTGVLFGHEVSIPDRSKMQMVEFTVTSPFTEDARIIMMNVASLAVDRQERRTYARRARGAQRKNCS